MPTTRIDDVHTFEEFGFRPLFAQQQPRTGSLTLNKQETFETPGAWYFGASIGTKEFDVPLALIEFNDLEKEEKIDKLVSFFLDDNGKPRAVKLSFRRNPDKFIFALLKGISDGEFTDHTVTYTLSFEAMDPFKYSLSNQYDLDTPLEYDAGHDYGTMAYPNTRRFDWIYTRHYSGLHNYSSLNTDIKMTIKGTVKGGKVTHLESGQSVSFPDIVNGVVVIDGQTYNVEVNGVDTIFDGEFFALAPGDNGFLFEAEEVSTSVEFEWWHKFN